MNKLIAISTGVKDVDMAPGNIPCVVINIDFVELCNKFGNTAVVLGPQKNLNEINLKGFDALIISGGGDIDPINYGEKKSDKTIRISTDRDNTELQLLKSAEQNNIKTLAICRGNQLLNVYKGGSLYQDISDAGFNTIKHDRPFEYARSHIHNVEVDKNSKLFNILNKTIFGVNSIHHQAINKLGKDLKINAKAPDEIIEGIESTTSWDAIGVQWHPENMTEDEISIKLFSWINS
ncbi:MAG: gamma-glutamyl-gamma-aminobutyrate hydrolase family protein [Actinomycetota bacterium]|nr:gamma-glutamyl-gamma-aminobutyrate hydrolase family protein [Actinomycetota bacterium]MDA3013175.1 gamma-glutamyl-gamma-aminobutyrate hydrolase family protein [Actinomycetota bacterium]